MPSPCKAVACFCGQFEQIVRRTEKNGATTSRWSMVFARSITLQPPDLSGIAETNREHIASYIDGFGGKARGLLPTSWQRARAKRRSGAELSLRAASTMAPVETIAPPPDPKSRGSQKAAGRNEARKISRLFQVPAKSPSFGVTLSAPPKPGAAAAAAPDIPLHCLLPTSRQCSYGAGRAFKIVRTRHKMADRHCFS